MAADTEPLEILLHLPILAEDKVWGRGGSKSEGTGKKTDASERLTSLPSSPSERALRLRAVQGRPGPRVRRVPAGEWGGKRKRRGVAGRAPNKNPLSPPSPPPFPFRSFRARSPPTRGPNSRARSRRSSRASRSCSFEGGAKARGCVLRVWCVFGLVCPRAGGATRNAGPTPEGGRGRV